ncbi:MAG TPA: c-type cytochrome [Candidatus Binatia bacterium]|nr:c-type cytochrome [Candidatus Binatia bacterium]
MQQVLFLALVVGVLLSSCAKWQEQTKGEQHGTEEHDMPGNWKFSWPQGNPAEGRKVFVEAECFKCHEIKGEQFPALAEKNKAIGPELSHMAGHPIEFLAESIINPNAVIEAEDKAKGYLGEDGKSKMPDYSDVLTVRQVADLAAYLASLKGGHKH